MSFRDLPWTWIVGPVVAVVLIGMAAWWRRRGDRAREEYRSGSRHSHRSGRGYPSGSGFSDGSGSETGAPQSPDQRALLAAANQLRDAMEKQARQMEELRTFWSRRLDELDRKIDGVARALPRVGDRGPNPQSGSGYGGYAAPDDAGLYGAESFGRQFPVLEPVWSPGPGDQPVEIRDGMLVISRSLPPAGYLSTGGSGQARVYLNAEVPLTEFSLPKWAAFFDLQGARPYAAYRTRKPAEVRWDEGAGRGELISKGTAEAI